MAPLWHNHAPMQPVWFVLRIFHQRICVGKVVLHCAKYIYMVEFIEHFQNPLMKSFKRLGKKDLVSRRLHCTHSWLKLVETENQLHFFNTFPLRQIFPDEVTHFWVYEMTPPSKKNNETGVWQRIIFEAISLCLLPDFPSLVPSPEMPPHCISPNYNIYFSKIKMIFVQISNVFVQADHI